MSNDRPGEILFLLLLVLALLTNRFNMRLPIAAVLDQRLGPPPHYCWTLQALPHGLHKAERAQAGSTQRPSSLIN